MVIKQQLEGYFSEMEARDQYSGVVLVTQQREELFGGAYGYASRAWKVRNTMETRFDTASITKLFTAIAMLQLIEKGELSFETRVIELLGLEDTTISHDVNVFHLLTHTSGIGDDAEEEAGESYEDIWKTRCSYLVNETGDFLPQFIHKPANFAPGEGARYCNCSFVLLGLIIEKITGMKYHDYIQQNVFDRAGMKDTGFFRLDRVNKNVAEGYDPILGDDKSIKGWKKNIYSFPPVGSPDSGAYVTAADLDHFLRAVHAGELLSSKMTRSFLTPQVDYREKKSGRMMFGYGLEFFVDAPGSVVYYEKEGINSGVSGAMRYYPEQDIHVVLLSNMMEGVWEPLKRVDAILRPS